MTRQILTLMSVFTVLFVAGNSFAGYVKGTPIQTAAASIKWQSVSILAAADAPDDMDFKVADVNDAAGVGERKSATKAALLAVLVPGLGEHYIGNRRRARYFFAVEAVSLISFLGFTIDSKWKTDDFIQLGNDRAGAQLEGRDDFFHNMVGFYDNVDDYNKAGRVSDPDRPYYDNSPTNHWQWQSAEDQQAYRDLKNQAREADRRASFMLGAMVLNRLVSVIVTSIDVGRHNRRAGSEFSNKMQLDYHLVAKPFTPDRSVSLKLTARF